MNFRPDIENFKAQHDVLMQQASSSLESWNDPVQKRFYEQFIDILPQEMMSFLKELNLLEISFENAERNIKELQ